MAGAVDGAGATGVALALEARRDSGAAAGVMARRTGTGPAGVVTASNPAVGPG